MLVSHSGDEMEKEEGWLGSDTLGGISTCTPTTVIERGKESKLYRTIFSDDCNCIVAARVL